MEAKRDGAVRGYRAGRRDHWRGILSAWSASGLSVREYCRRKAICAGTLYAWRRRLGTRAAVPAFVPVRVVGSPSVASASVVEVALRGGRLLRIHAEWSVETVARLVSALEPSSC